LRNSGLDWCVLVSVRNILALVCLPLAAAGADLSLSEILQRAGENQERAQKARTAFVYEQRILSRLHRGNGKLAREEEYQFLVTPTPTGIEKKRHQFRGKYEDSGKWHEYPEPHYQRKDVDIDGDLISDLTKDLTSDDESRDGISHDLFPLRATEQSKYDFTLLGREEYRGRDVYKLSFEPKKGGEASWEGEVLVDAGSLEPLVVTSHFARKIPLLVRTMLGTNVRHVGFKVTYAEQDGGVWFPAAYGGEFEVRAVFFYHRKFSLSLVNEGFRRAVSDATITFGDEVQ